MYIDDLGRLGKVWNRMVDDLFKSLGIRVNGWRILSVEKVNQLHFWLV